jgi:hypothetical protein
MYGLSGAVPWYARHDAASAGDATMPHVAAAVSGTERDSVSDSSQLKGRAQGHTTRGRSLSKEKIGNQQDERKRRKKKKRCRRDSGSPPPSSALKNYKGEDGKGKLSSKFAVLREERVARERVEAERARTIMHQHFAS